MKKKILSIMAVLVLTLGMSMPVCAEETKECETVEDTAGNIFSAGNMVNVMGREAFGLYTVGNNLDMSEITSKDSVSSAGYQISLTDSDIKGSAFAAGYSIDVINCDLAGNIVSAGNRLNIDNTTCNGIIFAGNTFAFSGEANAITVAASEVVIDGVVNGDVTIDADTVSITKNADIKGTLKIESKNEPQKLEGSYGSYEFEQIENSSDEESFSSKLVDAVKSVIYWSLAMCLVGLIMSIFANNHLEEAKEKIKNAPVAIIVTGIIGIIAVPLAVVVFGVTYIGLPLAAVVLTLFVLSICLATPFAGASIARIALPKLHPVLASMIGIVVLEIALKIPALGTIVAIAANIYTIGYVIQAIWSNAGDNAFVKKETDAIEVIAEAEVPQIMEDNNY